MLAYLALMTALLFVPTSAGIAPPTETCDSIHALVGGELVEWDSASYGWPSLPDDLERAGRVDFVSGGIWARHSKSEHARYIWIFTSYDQNADAQGQHFGAHSFCGPYRVSDE